MKHKLEKIEPYKSLGFDQTHASDTEVVMALPLAGNRNDKGTVFGGSLYSAMVLAAWRLCEEKAAAMGKSGDIFVKDSSIEFLRPGLSNMIVCARFFAPPATTRKGNTAFEAQVDALDQEKQLCATMSASFRLVDSRHAG
ncbi:MAG: YiiD C-terminal domain-containing protein [Gammaproteobacteria bacterium]